MTARMVSRPTAIKLVGRGVFIEVIRRKEFYVLLIMIMIFAAGAGIAAIVGVKDSATATMLLNLGLTLAAFSAQALTGLTAARQIPAELETRTLYPLLAKPIGRADYILGKWAAATACGCIAWCVLGALTWICSPHMGATYSAGALVQAVVVMCAGLGLLASIAIALSLMVPQGMNLVMMVLLVGFGDQVLNFIRARFIEGSSSGIVGWFLSYIPNFTDLNLVTRYTNGIAALGAGEFALLLLLAVVQTAAALTLAIYLFSRRAL